MKDLIQLHEATNEDLPDIYCDLDEVLVDFIQGANAAVDGEFARMDSKERWSIINNTKGFWKNLGWKPNAKRLYDFISKYDPHVLSAYTDRDPSSKRGKMTWLKNNAKFKRANIHLVLRAQKKSFAKDKDGSPNVLIDDYKKNINEWESAGGIGILHTNVGKSIGELKRLGFK
jgi:5'(3')-deoxyribonucleotidase